jgi:hypothetical protein
MVKHPKAYFTIEYHLCHIDDQSILAAIVPRVTRNASTSKTPCIGNLIISIGYTSQRLSFLMSLKVRKLPAKIRTCY